MGQCDASANSKTFGSVFVRGLRKGRATTSLDLRLLERILRGALPRMPHRSANLKTMSLAWQELKASLQGWRLRYAATIPIAHIYRHDGRWYCQLPAALARQVNRRFDVWVQ